VPVRDFVDGVRRELHNRTLVDPDVTLSTVYVGGGTPSRLGGDGVAALLDEVRGVATISPDAEVTIEANPEDVTPDATKAWRAAGVNRVSLGVQSFDPSVLEWMHRSHDVPAVHSAARALRQAGLDNWSLDLIFALPPEVPRDWKRDLHELLALDPPHVSAYGLTVEKGTALFKWRARGETAEADDGRYEEEFLEAHESLAAAGYEHYEVSNYGRPGRHSRHNSAYWQGVAYGGVGPSAHGFDGSTRRWNVREYTAWLQLVQADRDPIESSEILTAQDRELEEVYVGLRTTAGLALRAGDEILVAPWVAAGWGTLHEGRLTLTPLGWLRLDALSAALTAQRSRF
jgi:oxygen-independent coproporphyrinogen III oxidase